jgi:hypothetical protein
LARWNYAGGTWTAFNPATTTFGLIATLAIDQSGNLYIGGDFTNWDGAANSDRIAKLTGSAWSSLATGISTASSTVNCIVVANNTKIFVSGDFVTADGVTVNGVCYWNGTTFVALSTGAAGGAVSTSVLSMDLATNGDLYATGDFATMGGQAAANVAKWNGAIWQALGSGINNAGSVVAVADSGLVYVSGPFTSAGGLSLADRIASWNGSSWTHLDVDLPGSPNITAICLIGEDVYLGYDTSGTATTSYLNTVTNNGSRAAYPKYVIKRSGGTSAQAVWLKNETTGKTLWLNHSLLDGETLTIDLNPASVKATSSYFGDVTGRAILRGSDFLTWDLLPGSNSVSAYVSTAGSPTMTAYLQWRKRHWAVDGAAV